MLLDAAAGLAICGWRNAVYEMGTTGALRNTRTPEHSSTQPFSFEPEFARVGSSDTLPLTKNPSGVRLGNLHTLLGAAGGKATPVLRSVGTRSNCQTFTTRLPEQTFTTRLPASARAGAPSYRGCYIDVSGDRAPVGHHASCMHIVLVSAGYLTLQHGLYVT